MDTTDTDPLKYEKDGEIYQFFTGDGFFVRERIFMISDNCRLMIGIINQLLEKTSSWRLFNQ